MAALGFLGIVGIFDEIAQERRIMITFVTRARVLLQEGDTITSKKGVMMESAMLGTPYLIHQMKVENGALVALDKKEISEVSAELS